MDDNELKIISEISKNADASQRHLSKAADLSLGTVNIILHRLIEKGYMKIKQLDGRKVQYLLTPKGFAEKIDRSKQYLKNTILNVSVIKDTIRNRMLELYKKGKRSYYVLGGGELSHFVDIAVKESGKSDISCRHVNSLSEVTDKGGVILLTEGYSGGLPENGKLFIDLAKELAEVLI